MKGWEISCFTFTSTRPTSSSLSAILIFVHAWKGHELCDETADVLNVVPFSALHVMISTLIFLFSKIQHVQNDNPKCISERRDSSGSKGWGKN